MSARILVVDDDPHIRSLLERLLAPHGYDLRAAAGVAEARSTLGHAGADLVLCDIVMPDGSGLDVAREALSTPDPPAVVMVTAQDDVEIAAEAMRVGAAAYLTKPFTVSELLASVTEALRRRELERDVAAGAARLTRAYAQTVDRLAFALALHDSETGEHASRMARICSLLARRLGVDEATAALLERAAPLHDVGKLGVPEDVLGKRGPLTTDERAVVEAHTQIGHRMLAGFGSELLDLAATVALTHHEQWDGGGYPHGLTGEAIPLVGRIAAVADVLDALTSPRPYHDALPLDEAVATVAEGAGTQFDPGVVAALLAVADEI